MTNLSIGKKYEKIGARVKFAAPRPTWFGQSIDSERLTLDIRRDREGEYFEIAAGKDVDLSVIDVRSKDRHLLLMSENSEGKSKFLCGHDERHWFVAGIPDDRGASTVLTAMEALKPQEVLQAQGQKRLKGRQEKRRKNRAFVRQGEWFFIPVARASVDPKDIREDVDIGSRHVVEFFCDGLVQGYVRHPDHRTIRLQGWQRGVQITARSSSQVLYLD